MIYAGGDNTWLEIAKGYIMAAERLAVTMDQTGEDPIEDLLAFPIMFLVCHSIEIGMKAYLKFLLDHKNKKTCGVLSNINPSLHGHNLLQFFDTIYTMTQNDNLHSNAKDFLNFRPILVSLEQIGMNSESSRYSQNSHGKTHSIYDSQRYLVISEFLAFPKKINHFIQNAISASEFDLCSTRTFITKNQKKYNSLSDLFFKTLQIIEETSDPLSVIEKWPLQMRSELAVLLQIIKERGKNDSGFDYFNNDNAANTYIRDNLHRLNNNNNNSKISLETRIAYLNSLEKKWKRHL